MANRKAQAAYKLFFREALSEKKEVLIRAKLLKPGFDITSYTHWTDLIKDISQKVAKIDGKSLSKGFEDDTGEEVHGFNHPHFNLLAPYFGIPTYIEFLDLHPELVEDCIEKNNTGLFYLFSCSALEGGITKYPLLIEPNGKATIKIIRQNTESGKVLVFPQHHFMVVNFLDSFNDEHFMGTVFINSKFLSECFVECVTTRFNHHWEKPQSKREFIIPSKKLDPNNKNNGKTDREQFNESRWEIIYPNSQIFETYKQLQNCVENMPEHAANIPTYLIGNEGNLIQARGNKCDPFSSRQAFDRLFFNEAILEYLKKAKQINRSVKLPNEVTKFLSLSLRHGLLIENNYEKYLREFCKVCFITEDIEASLCQKFGAFIQSHSQEYSGEQFAAEKYNEGWFIATDSYQQKMQKQRLPS